MYLHVPDCYVGIYGTVRGIKKIKFKTFQTVDKQTKIPYHHLAWINIFPLVIKIQQDILTTVFLQKQLIICDTGTDQKYKHAANAQQLHNFTPNNCYNSSKILSICQKLMEKEVKFPGNLFNEINMISLLSSWWVVLINLIAMLLFVPNFYC